MGKLADTTDMFRTLVTAAKVAKPVDHNLKLSLGKVIAQRAQEYPNSVFCIFEERTVTWAEFDQMANRLANLLASLGVKKGDCVGVFIDNRVENMVATVALTRLGAISGLINTQLTGKPLLHCLESINASKLLFGEELLDPVEEVRDQLPFSDSDSLLFVRDQGDTTPNGCTDVLALMESQSTKAPAAMDDVRMGDTAYYIFTSGTTGLPKASIISHERWYRMSNAFAHVALQMEQTDRIYVCLPLYHSSAMYIGFGSVSMTGASMFLRRKFSASQFLEETRRHQTNCFVYIGELCRYLLNQPATPNDADNPVVKCTGNGLRPDIWMEFKNRFGIERIIEFYGATEGNAGCVNAFNRDKTVGFCATPHALVRYDIDNDEIVRNAKGRCIKVNKGDAGLMLIKITNKTQFDGYTNKQATEKKIVRDVFRKGDAWFNTGDLLRRVDVGFTLGLPHYQFVDRIGDTYRWKGENVSTNEVGEVINQSTEVNYSNVYGVELPGTDGRAGMAALVMSQDDFDIKALSQHIQSQLPGYSRPVFLRILPDMDTTGTFKLRKTELRDEAFHPDKVSDPLFVLKPGADIYEPLDEDFYQTIKAGKAGY